MPTEMSLSRMDDDAYRRALAAAEPGWSRPLGELVRRLTDAGQLKAVSSPPGIADPHAIPVAGIAYDSRLVVRGGCFVAVPGAHTDGHRYLAAAVAAGATVLVVETAVPPEVAAPAVQLVVGRCQFALATAATWWYGDPSDNLGIIGITGTDGKTTTAGMAAAALSAAGLGAGLISTAAQQVGALRVGAVGHVTTPEALEIARALRAMWLAGDSAAVLETTSHGIALQRVAGIRYDVAVFTNLTHEHLDFHGTLEAYRDVKARLFRGLGPPGTELKPKRPPGNGFWPRAGIVNADDTSAPVIADATREAGARLVLYGTTPGADVRATAITETPSGLTASVETPRGKRELRLPLLGGFNVHNALAVVALGEVLDLDPDAVLAGLAGFPGVAGRMERVSCGQPYTVVVDYAHTPAALAAVLDSLRSFVGPGGGLIAVFGSAGERDVGKRALQGHVAGERCRLVVATDEDPRREDPVAIIDQIAAGAEAAGRRRGEDLLLIPDRRDAIAAALDNARPTDVVLLAGKGHETSILYADQAVAWDERAVVEALLAERGFGPSLPSAFDSRTGPPPPTGNRPRRSA